MLQESPSFQVFLIKSFSDAHLITSIPAAFSVTFNAGRSTFVSVFHFAIAAVNSKSTAHTSRKWRSGSTGSHLPPELAEDRVVRGVDEPVLERDPE